MSIVRLLDSAGEQPVNSRAALSHRRPIAARVALVWQPFAPGKNDYERDGVRGRRASTGCTPSKGLIGVCVGSGTSPSGSEELVLDRLDIAGLRAISGAAMI